MLRADGGACFYAALTERLGAVTVSDGGRVGQGRYFGSRGGAEARRGLEVESKEGAHRGAEEGEAQRGCGIWRGRRFLDRVVLRLPFRRGELGNIVWLHNWPFDTPSCGGYSGRTVIEKLLFFSSIIALISA